MMNLNSSIWELAESYLAGSMAADEKKLLSEKLESDTDFAEEFSECVDLLKSVTNSGKLHNFRNMIGEIHKDQSVKPARKLMNKIIALPPLFWRTTAVAACVALITSSITYWSITPSIKKNDSQYNKISREVEHIKTGLKNNTADIESIKKSANTQPVQPASQAKFTGTGFALTNDGYFVTAWHVVNQGNFDSVYIQNNEGLYYKAVLVSHDDKADIAIMKVDKKNFRFGKSDLPYTIAKSKALLGARIFTIGYPNNDEVYAEGYISSRNGFEGDNLQYTLDLPAAHGQSGSPVVDAKGNIIGILTAVGSPGEANTYAVSTTALYDLIKESPAIAKVHQHRNNRLSWLGREQQIEKMEDYTFSVKVYKK